ncbi:MAG: lysophospholipid acyltransferase family protein [Pseudomonadota bacterium]
MKIKLAFRLVRIFLHVAGGLAACALVFPWAGPARRDGITRRWSRELLGMCGVSVEQAGAGQALAHAMIVSNHVSWLDIFVINALHPSHFVAKSEIRDWPVLGWLADKGGTVFIARGNRRELRHIFKGMVAALQAGQRVAFFPEGTTSKPGTVLPFHANLFEAAVDACVPVQPFALRYLDAAGALHHSVDFSSDMSFAQNMMQVLSGPPIRASLTCLAPIAAGGAHRRELAQAAHDAISGALHSA